MLRMALSLTPNFAARSSLDLPDTALIFLTCSSVSRRARCARTVRLSLRRAMIETFAPIEYGRATFQATRVPDGDSMVISLGATCRGMYNRDGTLGPNYVGCATQVSQAQLNFRHFIYQRM